MEKRRIPQVLAEFNDYIVVVADHLSTLVPGYTITRGEYLGMTSGEVMKLIQYNKAWHSKDINSPGLYDRHTSAATKTKVTRAEVVKFRKEFGEFFQPILTGISTGRNTTNGDRLTLRIAPPVTKRMRRTTLIMERCNVSFSRIGGGEVIFSCRADQVAGRAKKPPFADAIEFSYIIETPVYEDTDHGKPPIPIIKDHVYSDIGYAHIISTKARFLMRFGLENSGRYLFFYARWINTRHPELNGPVTGPWMLTIV